MVNIVCIITAYNEEKTLPLVVKSILSQNIPIIACLDNPTDKVSEIFSVSEKIYYLRRFKGEHLHREEELTSLVNRAAVMAQVNGYEWCLRIGSDEIWDNVREEIDYAERNGYDVIDFGITQHQPNKEEVNEFIPSKIPIAKPGEEMYVETHHMNFQRAWKLGTGISTAGGHNIDGGNRILLSSYTFHHFPAIDFKSLRFKISRRYPKEEIDKGLHWQYNHIQKDIK